MVCVVNEGVKVTPSEIGDIESVIRLISSTLVCSVHTAYLYHIIVPYDRLPACLVIIIHS